MPTLVASVMLCVALTSSAQAYVDPNTVGPIYQFLFPLLVAIASGFAMFKRAVKRMWHRLVGNRIAEIPKEADSTEAE